jgi:hypothetical protein
MNTRQLQWIGLSLGVILGVSILAIVRRDTEHAPAEPRGSAAGVDGVSSPPGRGDRPASARVLLDSAAPIAVPIRSRRVHVVDEGETPVPRAWMYRSGAWAPYVSIDRVVATTDDAGLIEWEPAPDGQPGILVVVGPGFLPGIVDADVEEQTVRLRRGEPFAVRCMDESGQPSSGVRVALGSAERGAPPLVEALGQSAVSAVLPGPSWDRAVFVQVSDAEGIARFPGLPPSRYYFSVDHPCMVKVDASGAARSPQGGVLVPGPDLIVTLAHAVAAVVCYPGQELVSCTGAVPRDQFDPRLQTTGCSRVGELRTAHADGLVLSHVPSAALRSVGRSPRMKVTLLLSHSGWLDVDVEFQRVAEGVSPVVIPAPAEAMCMQRRLVIRPALPEVPGFPQPIMELRGTPGGRTVSRTVYTDQSFWIPPARYRIEATSQFVAGAVEIPESIEVAATGPVEIELTRVGDLVPCELHFRLPRGMLLSSLSDVSAKHESGRYVYWPGWHALDAVVMPRLSPRQWIPPGVVVVRATEPSFGAASREFRLEAGDDVTALELEWEDG